MIYGGWNGNLGDVWASINCLLRLSEKTRKTIRLSRYELLFYRPTGRDLKPLYEEVIGLLDSTGRIEVVDAAADRPLNEQSDALWHTAYFPVRMPRSLSDEAAVHYEGTSNPDFQNVTKADQERLNDWLTGCGLKPVVLGLPHVKSVTDMVKILCRSRYFVGIDSGPSHVAKSCGLPVFLLWQRVNLDKCHPK